MTNKVKVKRTNQHTFETPKYEIDDKREKIFKVSKRVYRICKKNKVSDQDMVTTQEYIKNGFNKKQAYKITHPKQSEDSLAANAHQVFNKPAVQKSLEEILSDFSITKEKIINRHDEIVNRAMDTGQLSTALAGNKDFFPLVGIEKPKENTTNNIFLMSDGSINRDKIDALLFGGDYIEGEIA